MRLVSYGQRGSDLLLETPYGPLPSTFEALLFGIQVRATVSCQRTGPVTTNQPSLSAKLRSALSVLRSEWMPFFLNPKRRDERRGRARLLAILRAPIIRVGLWAGFPHIDYAYVHGDLSRVHVGARCSTTNTVFNVISGEIWIGDDTYFSHGCYVLTGQHRFYRGRRVNLSPGAPFEEVPVTGNDIRIGSGCYIGANATILASVTIGDNCIIGAGAVVTTDIPDGSFATGVPAIVRRSLPEA